jgi:hypothetical protein
MNGEQDCSDIAVMEDAMKMQRIDGGVLDVDQEDIAEVLAVDGELFWVFLKDGSEYIVTIT